MSSQTAVDERRRQVIASLQVGNPGNNARDLPVQVVPNGECQMELAIEQIHPYEHNPRRSNNAKFEDIKESIRAGGLRSPLTVTRRPGEPHFIVEAGGNTRLLALKQLWAETRDVRFQRLVVLFRPWRSESHVLTAHLIENEQRGDMSFWDRATGMLALKARLEAEAGRVLALRPLEDALHGLGLAVNTATLGLYLFATQRLRTLGEAVPDLAGLDVKTLQPRLNALRRLAQARAGLEEDAVYEQIFEPAFRRVIERLHHQRFTVAETLAACEETLAAHLGLTAQQVREAVSVRDGKRAKPGDTTTPTDVTGAPLGRQQDTNDLNDLTGLQGAMGHAVHSLATAPTPAPAWLTRVSRFAEVAGLSTACRLAPEAPRGFRVAALEGGQDPVQRRAWSLLAMVAGEDPGPLEGEVIGPGFFAWLADPTDPSVAAFWEVLEGLRPPPVPTAAAGPNGVG